MEGGDMDKGKLYARPHAQHTWVRIYPILSTSPGFTLVLSHARRLLTLMYYVVAVCTPPPPPNIAQV